jgi:hypothetical protein
MDVYTEYENFLFSNGWGILGPLSFGRNYIRRGRGKTENSKKKEKI